MKLHFSRFSSINLYAVAILLVLGFLISSAQAQRGRPVLNAARTTFVADNGQLLRGPYTSSEWGDPAPADQIANMKNYGFNAVHLYGECYDINYPDPGSTAPGYAASRIDSVVAATRQADLYLVITIGNGANNGNYNLDYVVDFWHFYAARYANETHVLFEIQNEPVAWGPPYSSPTATPPGAINMEAAAYNAIRSHAPDTPVLLFTYAVPWGAGGANDALTDVHAFNTAVFGNPNAVWTNEAVAIHGYSGSSLTSDFAAAMIGFGYPCFQTEFAGGIWGEEGGRFELYTASEMERHNVSWLTFQFIPPWGVSDNITVPEVYKDVVDRSGMSWTPDYGTWPQIRGPYGNGGQPRATTGLSGTLRIQAEDFDTGGQGVTYNDTTPSNQGGQYRTGEDVDIETTSDTGGGYNVGSTIDGEWLEYTILITEPGLHNLRLRVASATVGCTARVISYNLDKTGPWTIPNTGGLQTWTTLSKQVFLEYGRQKLRIEMPTGGFNLNWIELSASTTGPVADGTYKLANQNSGLVIENSSHTVVQKPYSGANTQQWNLQHLGAGQYRIRSASDNWEWSTCVLGPLGNGYNRMTHVDSGLNYEIENASLAGGAAVVSNVYAGSANQQWGVLAPSAPALPTGLDGQWVSSSQIDLTWTASAGATSYNVKRSSTSGGPYTTITPNQTMASYSDTGVIDGQVYYYVVSANTASGESLNSGEAAVTPWVSQDVGAVGVSGSTSYSNDVFTVSGSGADIWGTTDAFRFVYLPVNGDCTIVARVTSVQNTDGWAKAGVMFRESLNANSANAFIAVTPSNGVTFQWRSTAGGTCGFANTTGLISPYWVKLQRSGNTFTAYRSADGTIWTQQGTPQTITMASSVYIGMAVTSHNNSTLCQAVFDNVTAPGWPPTIVTPAAPTNLVATAGDGSVSLDWADNTEPDLDSYNVYRHTTTGGPYTQIASGVIASNLVDNTVVNGTTYYYVVTAVNTASHESGYSNEDSATPAGAIVQMPYGGVPWSIPGTVQAENYDTGGQNVAYNDSTGGNTGGQYRTDDVDVEACGEGGYDVGWTTAGEWLEYTVDVASTASYNITVRAASSWAEIRVHIEFDGVDVTGLMTAPTTGGWQTYTDVTATDITLNAGQHVIRVYLDGPDFNINYIAITASTDTTPPAPPIGLTATAGDGSVALDWADNTEPDLMHYDVYRSITSGSGYVSIYSGQTTSDYTDNTVTNGTTYYYVVTAVDTSSNESAYSNEDSAMPQAPDTTPPTPNPATFATAPYATGSNSITMVATTGSDVSGPVEYLFTETSGNPGGTSSGWQTSTSYTDSGLNPSTQFTYTVTMRDAFGNTGTASAPASATTQAAAPPSYVAAGSIASGTGTITTALPSGIVSGDILLLFVETANQAVSISNSNGGTWASVANSPQGTGTAGGTSATRLTVFWSRYNGTQGAPTVSDSGNHQIGRMIAIRGAASTGDPWDVTAGGIESTSDTSASVSGAITTTANTLVVTAVAGSLPDTNGTSNFSAWTNANLTSLTERTDNTRNAGNGGALGIATGVKATAGAYGNTAVTHASSAVKAMMSIAIRN